MLLLSLLTRLGLTLALSRLGLSSGQLGLLPSALFRGSAGGAPVALIGLGSLVVTEYVLVPEAESVWSR